MRVKDLVNTYSDWSGQSVVGVYIETGDNMPVFIGHLLVTEIDTCLDIRRSLQIGRAHV